MVGGENRLNTHTHAHMHAHACTEMCPSTDEFLQQKQKPSDQLLHTVASPGYDFTSGLYFMLHLS